MDNAQLPYGRMRMAHMVADSTAELLAMADAIGVQRKWLQKAGTAYEHFDVCMAKRDGTTLELIKWTASRARRFERGRRSKKGRG